MRLFCLLILFLTFPISAKADYFLWQDPGTGMSMTFPDTWKVQTNRRPGDTLTVMAPSDYDQPMCTLSSHQDRRYTIYPANYGRDVQQVAVSTKFWQDYLGRYSGYQLGPVVDGAGLGRWHASYATASYTQMFGSVMQQRRALMFASLYNDRLYVLECSSLAHAYENWVFPFQSIVKSVDFKKAYHELPTGEYANFLSKARRYFWSQTSPIGTTAY